MGKKSKEEFLEEKKRLRKYLGEKRKEEEKELRNLKKKKEIWKFINRKRKKRD